MSPKTTNNPLRLPRRHFGFLVFPALQPPGQVSYAVR
jgi:hypothetical protein